MKKFFLFIFIIIFFSTASYARRTGCEGDCENGSGTWTYTDQTVYKGEWLNSKKHGKGTLTFPDGSKYIGEWFEDNMNGQGTFTLADGTIRKGIWKNGVLVESD